MRLRNKLQSSIELYIKLVCRFFDWFGKSPAQATRDDVRAFLLHKINEEGDGTPVPVQ